MKVFYKLRIWIKTFIARHRLIIEFCDDCGRRVGQVWHAPDALWLEFNQGDEGGCLCIRCFDNRADTAGVLLMWRPEIDCRRSYNDLVERL